MKIEGGNMWNKNGLIMFTPLISYGRDRGERIILLGWLLWACTITFEQKEKE